MTAKANHRQTIWMIATSLFVVSVLASGANAQGQWETSGTNTYYNAGTVGIGTSSPGSPLHVQSDQSYNGEVGQLRLSPATNPTKRLYMGFDNSADFGYIQAVHSAVGYKSLILQPSAGYVGIGTTSPSYHLQVAGDVGIGVQSGRNGSLVFFNATNSSYGVIEQTSSVFRFYQAYSSTGGYVPMTFTTGGSERIRIATDGKVGIGTTSPGSPLHVQSDQSYNGEVGQLRLSPATNPTKRLYMGFDDSADFGYIQAVHSAVGYKSLILQPSAGYVGIGTTSPSYHLQVAGDVGIGVQSGRNGSLVFFNATNSSYGLIQQTSSVFGFYQTYSSTGGYVPMTFTTGGSERIRIATDGKVGIGTTSPGTSLDVKGDVGITISGSNYDGAYILKRDYASGYMHIVGGQSSFSGYRFFLNSTTEALTVLNSGNVGIGTSGPAERLEVNGNLKLSGTGNLTAAGTIDAVGGLKINGSLVTSSQWSAGSGNINYTSGNVGIGRSDPSYKLDVYGPSANHPGRVASPDGYLLFGPANTAWSHFETDRPRFYFNTAVTVDTGNVGSYDEDLSLQTSGTTRLTINNSTGNVGIGTPDPQATLHVQGSGKVTGSLTVDGNISAKYQDMAEWVESSEQLAAGTVVILDSTKSNQVTSSSVSYDTRVAGVISAQPGITLGEKSDSKVLVATTGRVKVKVDASKSPIHIGDLLVTSDVPGVAMKSEAVNLGGVQFHRPGTLIGKALEPLEKGKGEILVLLSLQ